MDQREECLLGELERVRSSAGKMLEERQETSAQLKVLGERLLNHTREQDSNHIRAKMKVWHHMVGYTCSNPTHHIHRTMKPEGNLPYIVW